jgi:hypothetical protein
VGGAVVSLLEKIIASPNRVLWRGTRDPNIVRCVDGFKLSVVSGEATYCSPRNDEGPYEEVEVGFPSELPEPWSKWITYCESPESPTKTVYGYVPVDMVRALVALHGGEVRS